MQQAGPQLVIRRHRGAFGLNRVDINTRVFNEPFMCKTVSEVESGVGRHLCRRCPDISPKGALTATLFSPPQNLITPVLNLLD